MNKLLNKKALEIKLDNRSKYLRQLIVQALIGGGRGHMGSAMSLVEILRVLYDKFIEFDPKNLKKLILFSDESLNNHTIIAWMLENGIVVRIKFILSDLISLGKTKANLTIFHNDFGPLINTDGICENSS